MKVFHTLLKLEKDRRDCQKLKNGEWLQFWQKFIGNHQSQAPAYWTKTDREGKKFIWKNIRSFEVSGTGQFCRKDWVMKQLSGQICPSKRPKRRKRRSDFEVRDHAAKRRQYEQWKTYRKRLVKKILKLLDDEEFSSNKLTKKHKVDVIRYLIFLALCLKNSMTASF